MTTTITNPLAANIEAPGAGIRQQLQTAGHAVYRGSQVRLATGLLPAAKRLADAFEHLPPDPYCKDGTRCRRYGVFLFDANADELRQTAIRTYQQSSYFNSEHGDLVRSFAPLGEEIANNEFLHAMIRFDARQLPMPKGKLSLPMFVGVHLLRLAPRPGRPAGAFPKLHKDGEWFTFSHLMHLEGVVGGGGLVTDNAKQPLWRGQQQEFLDTFAVVDAAVYHHVDPVELAPGVDAGRRDVALIDFTPLIPEIMPARWRCSCSTIFVPTTTFAARCTSCGQDFINAEKETQQ